MLSRIQIGVSRGTLTLAALVALLAASAGFAVGASEGATGGTTATGAHDSKALQADSPRAGGKSSGRAKTTFKLSHRHLTVGNRVKLHGRARPGGKRAFKVVVKGPSTDVVKESTDHSGRFRRSWRPDRPGVYHLRSFAGHNRHAKGAAGPSRRLTVYRPAFASWFGPGWYGSRTACGQILTSDMLGVAHKTMPCGTKLTLKYGSRRVSVRVIDRGPYIAGREFDLTYATKEKLGFGDLGTVYSSR